MLGYLEGTAEQSGALFADTGTLELPYLASIGMPPVMKGPVEGQERGVGNYGSAGLLASSAGRGWSGLAAELRSHSSVIASMNPIDILHGTRSNEVKS
jgi:hypothetical protein